MEWKPINKDEIIIHKSYHIMMKDKSEHMCRFVDAWNPDTKEKSIMAIISGKNGIIRAAKSLDEIEAYR